MPAFRGLLPAAQHKKTLQTMLSSTLHGIELSREAPPEPIPFSLHVSFHLMPKGALLIGSKEGVEFSSAVIMQSTL